jgi:hypothetical protein
MLQAIDTKYKNYFFRSRLEARYALFFDEANIKWQYEVEGFQLPSGWYLPEYGYVEVKPTPMTFVSAPRVYMAGRMATSGCYRPFDVTIANSDLEKYLGRYSTNERLGPINIEYVGPFGADGSAMHGQVQEDRHVAPCSDDAGEIFHRSLVGIDRCDVFFALLEDLEAFGTLVELGIAHNSRKDIVVGFTRHPTDPGDLWFAAESADRCLYGTREEILTQFGAWLDGEYPRLQDQRKAEDFAHHSQKDVTMCFGDPVSAINEQDDGGIASIGSGRLFSLLAKKTPSILRAATLARQARFEHGATP